MKWLSVAVGFGLLLAIIVLVKVANDMKERVRVVEESRRRICVSLYRASSGPATYAEKMLFKSVCDVVMTVGADASSAGLVEYHDFLVQHGPNVAAGDVESLGDAMRKTFHQSFLFAEGLRGFESASDFDNFAHVNFSLAMYYGEQDIRRGQFESLTAIEYLAYEKFKGYEEQFRTEGRTDLMRIASDFLRRIIEHIESQGGFTRQAARHMVLLNTEYAEVMRSGGGLSKGSAIRLGRAYVNGLVNVGYKPKWLDVEYPCPDSNDEPERTHSAWRE